MMHETNPHSYTGTHAASPNQRQGSTTPSQGTHTKEFTVIDFSTGEVMARAHESRKFRIHAIGAVLLSVGAFLAWTFTSFAIRQWPWFMLVWGGIALSLAVHFYVFERPKEYLQLHFMSFFIVNLMVFFSWVFTKNTHGHAWFIEVFFITSILLGLHYNMTIFAGPAKWMNFHVTTYTLLNFLFFSLWLDTGKGLPWFLYTALFLAVPLYVHWTFHFNHEDKLWNIHLFTFIDLNIALFFTWSVTGMGFPWFVFPLLVWGTLLALHGYWSMRALFSPAKAQAATSAFSVGTVESPVVTPVNYDYPTMTKSVTGKALEERPPGAPAARADTKNPSSDD